MRTVVLLTIMLTIGVHALYSQADSLMKFRGRSIGVAMGLGHNRLIDEGLTYNKTLFRGNSFNIQLDYSLQKEKFLFTISGLADFGNVKADEGKLKTKFYQVELALSYLRKFKRNQLFGKQGQLSAGPELSLKGLVLENMHWLDNIDMLAMSGLYLNIQQQLQIAPDKMLRVRLILPLAAFVKHENLNGVANQEMVENGKNIGRLLFRHTTLRIPVHLRFHADYIKRIAPGTDLFLQYNFSYIKTTLDKPLNVYSNELLGGLRFYFKS